MVAESFTQAPNPPLQKRFPRPWYNRFLQHAAFFLYKPTLKRLFNSFIEIGLVLLETWKGLKLIPVTEKLPSKSPRISGLIMIPYLRILLEKLNSPLPLLLITLVYIYGLCKQEGKAIKINILTKSKTEIFFNQ